MSGELLLSDILQPALMIDLDAGKVIETNTPFDSFLFEVKASNANADNGVLSSLVASVQEHLQENNTASYQFDIVLTNAAIETSLVCFRSDPSIQSALVIIKIPSEFPIPFGSTLEDQLFQEKQSYSILENLSKNIIFRYEFSSNAVRFSGALLKQLTGRQVSMYDISELRDGNTILKPVKSQLKKLMATILHGKNDNASIIKVSLPDKTLHWLSVEYSFIRDTDNRLVAAVGEIIDVTEEVAAKEYYEKALSLWFASRNDCVAALSMNLSTGKITNGFSKLELSHALYELTADEYFSAVANAILHSPDKDMKKKLTSEKLISAYLSGTSHFSYEAEIKYANAHIWLQLGLTLLQNPSTHDIIALMKWTDINNGKLRQHIDRLLLSDTYDFICCIFLKTDSYMMISDYENNNLKPSSLSSQYTSFINRIIDQYADRGDVQYLKYCFGLKNLKTQLNICEEYSFIGHGFYPDGTPTVKYHQFRYLSKEKQIILYTRKDITNRADFLSFQIENTQHNIPFSDVIYIESFGKKSSIVTAAKKYEVKEMITNLQKRLPGRCFIRCHRCYLVNINAIKSIRKYEIEVSNGDIISVNRGSFTMLRDRITDTDNEL
ncbi:LytTR family DNA-binding domain-containing protein [Anaerotignum sp.]|uniref:LytTR family DNA-binding domain-containing protein n=1 Tax=Anaerotignum sp. TaxID=2039241 RepID=UPI0028AEE576|nr:LytTR family DNA-binding domain-containing protein [Anaerotignum sp.]